MPEQTTVMNASEWAAKEALNARNARIGLMDCIREWGDHEINELWGFALAVKNNRGDCITPIEDAIITMVGIYASSLEPNSRFEMGIDHLEASVEQAKENFNDTLEIARIVNSRYPKALSGAAK